MAERPCELAGARVRVFEWGRNFVRFSHARVCKPHAHVNLTGSTTGARHSHVAQPWHLIVTHFWGNLCPVFTCPLARPCSWPCPCGKLVLKSSVKLRALRVSVSFPTRSMSSPVRYYLANYLVVVRRLVWTAGLSEFRALRSKLVDF
ncbi:hypothetical protein GOBAR_AA25017 [Gossypium barbadense]|uniref:Uncharacterized protein n=1 Tax=Gossypium barbadense TaxID=3634 RepID=A0A2P5WX34_GOSBA|nr:hypothetical protein GOBAR_AA25017 [Gossypium barbadense]